MLHVTIHEKLNVKKDKSPRTLKDQIEDALPALEEAIIKKLGSDSYLRNFDLGLSVEEFKDRYGNQQFRISSNNLVELTGPIGKILYDKFIFKTSGGTKGDTPNKNTIYFSPKFDYDYKTGGSNGTNAFWILFWYDIDEDEWIFGREL